MKYVLIHETYWNPDENWFPWLKRYLQSQWHAVYVPRFPTPENQTIASRCEILQRDTFRFDEETVLIGHSLGALYLLHILELEREQPIKKAILVSWFTGELWIEEFDILNTPFLKDTFDWETIRTNANEYILLHGDNDPYVPLRYAHSLQANLWAKLVVIKNGWHLNESAWYTKFEELLEVL